MGIDIDVLQKKLQELSARAKKVKQQRAEILGSLNAKKEELTNLVKDIQSAGYNPKTIKDEYEQQKKQLEDMMEVYEAQLVKAENSIEEFYRK